MSYDLVSHMFFEPATTVPTAERTSAYTGPAVDMLETEGMATLFLTGTLTAECVVTMTECDTSGGSFTALSGPALTISNQLPKTIAVNATNDTYAVNFTRSKRYVKVVLTGDGHTLVGMIVAKKKYLGS
jgi:hypothetical protein